MGKRIVCMILLGMILLTGCSEARQEIGSEDPFGENSEKLSEKGSEDSPEESGSAGDGREQVQTSITVGGGVADDIEDMSFVYDGKPIEFDYSLESDGACTVGLQIFLDGIQQTYEVEGESTTMYQADLDNETCTFHVSFMPVTGQKGDTVKLLFVHVFNPIFIAPNENGVVLFGNNHGMSSPLFWYIDMKESADNTEELPDSSGQTIRYADLTEEETEHYLQTDVLGNSRDLLDNVHLEVLKDNVINDSFILDIKNENLSVKLLGGPDQKYRISFYSNFKLLDINGCKYTDIDLKKGQSAVIELPSDCLSAGEDFYAIAIPLGESEFWAKSDSIYLEKK